jgi:ethanolamine-phosphate phospho-lyase
MDFKDELSYFKTIGDVRGVGMFVGFELVSDRFLRTPNRAAADFVLKRFRAEKVLMQADGPDVNVIKLKPPLPFSKVNNLRS